MYRVYAGNIDSEVTEADLYQLLQQHGLSTTGVVLKRGYAFIDCADAESFEQTIQQLNGYNLLGTTLQVESSAISKRLRTSCIQVTRIPRDVSHDVVLQFVSGFGPVQQCDIVEDQTEAGFNSAIIDYGSWQLARQAMDSLDELDFHGSTLKVQFVTDTEVSSPSGAETLPTLQRATTGLPLRVLVASDFIGAIIGRKGQTIRNITTQTKARIDVHGKENTGLMEKMVSIFGDAEQCSAACREILTIMQREAINANRGDVTLRMLIDDRYCGRIIGREGKTIKKIREETSTRISISNVQEMASIYPDRVIAVRGNIDSMSAAEAAISYKLRECYERDYLSISRQPVVTSAVTEPSVRSYVRPPLPSIAPVPSDFSPPGGASYLGGHVTGVTSQHQPPLQQLSSRETCHIGIPNYAVGAIIGAAGANIKRIIRDSNAFVTVEPRRDDQNPADERFVTIKGNTDACWRASYFIFEKMRLEGFCGADGDVRLRTVISIPQSAAGRVVGKGGKNVREIQRSTGSIITLPAAETARAAALEEVESGSDGLVPDGKTVPDALEEGEEEEEEEMIGERVVLEPAELTGRAEVTVEVYGNFISTQSAHNRIRSLVYRTPPTTTQQRPGAAL